MILIGIGCGWYFTRSSADSGEREEEMKEVKDDVIASNAVVQTPGNVYAPTAFR